jgi:peroxiredoxin
MELEALNKIISQIEAIDATIVAISPQQSQYMQETVHKLRLSFDLLQDGGNRIASRFGLVFTLPDYLRPVYMSFGIDLAKYNGDNSWTLPMPGRFIIDKTAMIRDVDVDPDYTIRPKPSQIIDILKSMTR